MTAFGKKLERAAHKFGQKVKGNNPLNNFGRKAVHTLQKINNVVQETALPVGLAAGALLGPEATIAVQGAARGLDSATNKAVQARKSVIKTQHEFADGIDRGLAKSLNVPNPELPAPPQAAEPIGASEGISFD